MLAYSAHACLPTIYGSMHRPQDFPTMVNVAFFAMFAMYAVMGGFGYLVFGKGRSAFLSCCVAEVESAPLANAVWLLGVLAGRISRKMIKNGNNAEMIKLYSKRKTRKERFETGNDEPVGRRYSTA